MLSSHSASLHRISFGMAVVAILTVSGLALTASGTGGVDDMARVATPLGGVKHTRFSAFKPNRVPEMMPPEAPPAVDVPAEPAPVSSIAPPAPPAPPMSYPSIHEARVPSQADIAAMVPDIRVDQGCNGKHETTTQDFVGASGRRHIRISTCSIAIQNEAMKEARASMAEARRAIALAHAMSVQDRAQAMAEAQADLAEARAEIFRARAEARREAEQSRAEID